MVIRGEPVALLSYSECQQIITPGMSVSDARGFGRCAPKPCRTADRDSARQGRTCPRSSTDCLFVVLDGCGFGTAFALGTHPV